MQETFLVVLAKPFEHRGHATTASYLRAVAKNLLLRRRRDLGRREAATIEYADELWGKECGRDDGDGALSALRHCLDRLDGRSAQVVQRFYREGQSRAAVASELGIQQTGFKTLLQRLRAGLRNCMEARMRDER